MTGFWIKIKNAIFIEFIECCSIYNNTRLMASKKNRQMWENKRK
jgi:hypothetical protein